MTDGELPPAPIDDSQEPQPERVMEGYSHRDLADKIRAASSSSPTPNEHDYLETPLQSSETVGPKQYAGEDEVESIHSDPFAGNERHSIGVDKGMTFTPKLDQERKLTLVTEEPESRRIPVTDANKEANSTVDSKDQAEVAGKEHEVEQKTEDKPENLDAEKEIIKGPDDCLKQADYLREKVHEKIRRSEELTAEDIKDLQFASAWEMIAADWPNLKARQSLRTLDKNLSLAS